MMEQKNIVSIPGVVLKNKKLSLKAKGLYFCILYHMGYGEQISKKMLLENSCEGKKAFNRAWMELKTMGYLNVYQSRLENGRWISRIELK